MQICTFTQTDYHTIIPPLSFLQAGCFSCRPTNSVKALKAVALKALEGLFVNSKADILHTANQCTKFEFSSLSHSRDISGKLKTYNLHMSELVREDGQMMTWQLLQAAQLYIWPVRLTWQMW